MADTAFKVAMLLLAILLLTIPGRASFLCLTNSEGITITGYTGTNSDLTIPDTINGLPVTRIGDYAFDTFTNLHSVEIGRNIESIGNGAFVANISLQTLKMGDRVSSIGDHAFRYCFDLTNLVVPDSVTNLGIGAFASCSNLASISLGTNIHSLAAETFESCSRLSEISLPESLRQIGDEAFSNCDRLSSVLLPLGTTNIGYAAFARCNSLTEFRVSKSVLTIGDGAFIACNSLTNIVVDGDNPNYASEDAILFNKPKTKLLSFAARKDSQFVLPPQVTEIGNVGFAYCIGLTNIVLHDNLVRIGNSAFFACSNLIDIAIPDSIVGPLDNPFTWCQSLREVRLGSGITNLLWFEFATLPSLTNLTVSPNHPTFLSKNGILFSPDETVLVSVPGGRAADFVIPDGIKEIGQGAFEWCPFITDVNLPGSLKVIGAGSFRNCTNLVSATIPNSVTTVEAVAFGYCGRLEQIEIGTNVASIGERAFAGCRALTNVVFPSSVTNLGFGSFEDCSGLTHISLPTGLTFVGDLAFHRCLGLTNISVNPQNPSLRDVDGVLFDHDLTTLLAFPGGKPGQFRIPHSVTNIAYDALRDCPLLTRLYFSTGAPSFESPYSQFSYDSRVTIYHLPNAPGWESDLMGRPTELWLPELYPSKSSNAFSCRVEWAEGTTVVLETSPAPTGPTWIAVSTNILTGDAEVIVDVEPATRESRFYRVRSP